MNLKIIKMSNKGSDSKTIVWFRRDLRIEDNPALSAAAKDGAVYPIFIWCPKEEGQFYPGRVSRWWLKQSLCQLDQSLRSLGAPLSFFKSQSSFETLLECVRAIGATKIVYNHLYDPVSLVRDHEVKQKLGELGISVQSYNADLLNEPWEICDEKGYAFTNFDEYWNKCLSMHMTPVSHLPPWRLVPAAGIVFDSLSKHDCSIEQLDLEDETEKASNALLGRAWSPGWSNADKALSEFIEQHLLNYAIDRKKLADNSTSLLSPHLHFGELSPRKIYHSVRMKQILWAKERSTMGEESASLFLRSIGLREYSRYICFNFPFTHERSLLSNLKYFPWNLDQTRFKVWRQGRTGYPLVDAGMRELWATGWVHNKIRVIVSSFFVKFLLLPWQWGMKYFWDTLLDADLESDILGWQYISGSLPDGHELERLDSPEVQGFKYDSGGEYIRQWLPELARMPAEWIHHPWNAPASVLQSAGVELGINYPKPIIDEDLARDQLTQAIITMREHDLSSKAKTSNGLNEEVFDNSENLDNISPIPKVVVKERVSLPTNSSNDQRVPSVQNVENGNSSRKRGKCVEDDEELKPCKDLANRENRGESLLMGDLCSTAESGSDKKQCTSSMSTFSVPHSYCLTSKGKTFDDLESSDVNEGGHVSTEPSGSKNEAMGEWC